MGVIRSASVGVFASVALAWACGGAGAFACNDDPQCAGGGELGRCESTGYCSFADDACPSGRRYGARAPSDLADACVPPQDATSVAESADDVADDGDPTDDGTTGTTDTPSDSTSPTSMTTTPVDPTTGDETTSGDVPPLETTDASSLDGDAESTTMIEPMDPPCEPTFVDDFEDGALDPSWTSWVTEDCTLVESGGHLELSIALSPVVGVWSEAGVWSEPFAMIGGHVRTELVPFSPPLDAVGVWLTLVDPDACELQIAAWNSQIVGRSGGVFLTPTPAETDEPLWLQIRVDSESTAYWEWSTDGSTWNELHSEPSPCDMSSAWTALFAGDEHAYMMPIVREVESFERCQAP